MRSLLNPRGLLLTLSLPSIVAFAPHQAAHSLKWSVGPATSAAPSFLRSAHSGRLQTSSELYHSCTPAPPHPPTPAPLRRARILSCPQHHADRAALSSQRASVLPRLRRKLRRSSQVRHGSPRHPSRRRYTPPIPPALCSLLRARERYTLQVPATAALHFPRSLIGLACTGGKRTYTDLAPGTYAAEAAEYAAAQVPLPFLSPLSPHRCPLLVRMQALASTPASLVQPWDLAQEL